MKRSRVNRTAVLTVMACAALIFGGLTIVSFTLKSVENQSVERNTQLIRGLEQATAAACYRLNVHRAFDNDAAYQRWLIDRQNVSQLRHGIRTLPRTEKVLHLNPHNKTVKLLIQASVAQNKRTIARLQAASRAEEFAPWTNCRAADARPATYRPPHVISFDKALKRRLYRFELHHQPLTPQQGHYATTG